MTDEATARRRHCEYIALRLGHVRDHDVGQPSTLLAMDIELEDIRAAWLHAVQLRDGEAIQAMAPPLARYFAVRGRTVEGIALLDQAAGAWSDRQASTGAVVQQALASLFHRSGDLDRAEAAVRTAIRLQRTFRRGGATQPSLYLLGAILYTRGEFATAKRYFEHALRVAQAASDTAGTAKALNGLAGCARAAGDYSRALALQRQALELHESLGNVHEQALLLNDIGVMLHTSHRYGEACQVLQRGLALTAAHGLDGAREYCLFTLGMTEIELGRFDDARGHLRQSLQIDRAAGAGLVAWGAHLGLARADIRTGAATTASVPLGEGVKRARALKSVQAADLCAWLRCRVACSALGARARRGPVELHRGASPRGGRRPGRCTNGDRRAAADCDPEATGEWCGRRIRAGFADRRIGPRDRRLIARRLATGVRSRRGATRSPPSS